MEPLSIGLVILSVIAILLSIIILVLLIAKKLEPKSKPADKKTLDDKRPGKSTSKPDEKISSLWIVPFAVFIVILIGLIAAVFIMKHDIEEEKMNKIMSDTNIILKSARTRVDTVSLSRLVAVKSVISSRIDVIPDFINHTGFEELQLKDTSYEKLLDVTRKKIAGFKDWILGVISKFPSNCGTTTDVDKDKIKERIDKSKNIRKKLGDAIYADKNIFSKMQENLTTTAESQQNLDVGEGKLENHINTMKAMLDHFGTDISKSEKTRQRWIDKMSSTLPTFSTHFIIKILVPITCGVIIAVCIVIIIVIIRPKFIGPKLLSLGKKVPIYTTGVVKIITSGIVIVACLGLVGPWTCSLRVGYFGISNFTSPFNGITTVSICEIVDSKFFVSLGNDPLITSDSVVQSFKVNEYKQKILEIVIGTNTSIDVPVEFSQELDAIGKSLTKLDELFGRNCLEANDQQELSEYQQTLKTFLNESKSYTDSIETFNENLAKSESIATPLIDNSYKIIVNSFNTPISDIQEKITASDFSCNPIIASYANTADSICKKFEVPLEVYWIILMLTILCLMVILILQTIVYRHLKNVKKVDLKLDDNNKKENGPEPEEMPKSAEVKEDKVEEKQEVEPKQEEEKKPEKASSTLTFPTPNLENQDNDGKKKFSTPTTPMIEEPTQEESEPIEKSPKKRKKNKKEKPKKSSIEKPGKRLPKVTRANSKTNTAQAKMNRKMSYEKKTKHAKRRSAKKRHSRHKSRNIEGTERSSFKKLPFEEQQRRRNKLHELRKFEAKQDAEDRDPKNFKIVRWDDEACLEDCELPELSEENPPNDPNFMFKDGQIFFPKTGHICYEFYD